MNPNEEPIKQRNEIYCLDCDKYFSNIDSYNSEHEKTVYKVLNKTHTYITNENSLELISKILKTNKLLLSAIKEQQNEISSLTKRLELYEDSFKDISFDCNIAIKNGEEFIKNLGKCNLQFFVKKINFRIECKGVIENAEENRFQINIMFPFKKANLKQCYIEKFNGCFLSENICGPEGNPLTYYHNYICYLEQNNYIISVKSLRDYSLPGKFEKKNINIIINGMLSFDSLIVDYNKNIILFNILDKAFLCYENYHWKFIDDFNIKENDDYILNKNCLVNFLFESDDKVRIKGEHKYLGFEPNFVTLNEKDSLFDINFLNKMYGLVEISKNGKNLAMDKEGNVCYVKEKMFYLVCNV